MFDFNSESAFNKGRFSEQTPIENIETMLTHEEKEVKGIIDYLKHISKKRHEPNPLPGVPSTFKSKESWQKLKVKTLNKVRNSVGANLRGGIFTPSSN